MADSSERTCGLHRAASLSGVYMLRGVFDRVAFSLQLLDGI